MIRLHQLARVRGRCVCRREHLDVWRHQHCHDPWQRSSHRATVGQADAAHPASGFCFDDLLDLSVVLYRQECGDFRRTLGSVDSRLRRTHAVAAMTDNVEIIVGAVGIVVFVIVFIAGLQMVQELGEGDNRRG